MHKGSRIFVAGHQGLIGSALLRQLRTAGHMDVLIRTRAEVDLEDPKQLDEFFRREMPEYVFLAAGKVGGIEANRSAPAEFIRANLAIQTAVLHAAYVHGVKRLIFFGSACMYPRDAEQPVPETSLMTGSLEPTSEAYAMAKLAGTKMCEAYNRQYGTRFLAVVPASAYGPNDHFDIASSHVLSALIRRFHDAKTLGTRPVLWGTGAARREFIYVDDVADACLLLMQVEFPGTVVNIGAGEDIAIRDLALLIRRVVGAEVDFDFDRTKPDGTPRKVLDSSILRRLGWAPRILLDEGTRRTYQSYCAGLEAGLRLTGSLGASVAR